MPGLNEFQQLVQRYVVQTAIGPSATRRLIPKGSIDEVREFLKKEISPELISNVGSQKFSDVLDGITEKLQACSKHGHIEWGPARKFLNLYLRDLAYNYYLRNIFDFNRLEKLLEIPMDSHVAGWLTCQAKTTLPKWEGVKRLSNVDHKKFQEFATQLAAEKKTLRVHLDLEGWRNPKAVAARRGL